MLSLDLNTISKSYPYLDLARLYRVDYGDVLTYVDFVEHPGNEARLLLEQRAFDNLSYDIRTVITAVMRNEHRRRKKECLNV